MSVFPKLSLADAHAERCDCPLMVYHVAETCIVRVAIGSAYMDPLNMI